MRTWNQAAPAAGPNSARTTRELLAEATADLRQAVIEDRYADTKELLASYSRVLEEASDVKLVSEAGEFIEWARRLILARRASLAGQHRQLTSKPRRCYRAPISANTATVHALDIVG